MNEEKRILLGVVGVDSGQMVLADPCYIEDGWIHQSEAEVTGVDFWGKNESAVQERMESKGWQCHKKKNGFRIKTTAAREVENQLQKLQHEGLYFNYGLWHETATYDVCGDMIKNSKGGQLHFVDYPEVGVVFESGFGDGTYEVWATIRDYGKLGKRIAKVEINLITEEGEPATPSFKNS